MNDLSINLQIPNIQHFIIFILIQNQNCWSNDVKSFLWSWTEVPSLKKPTRARPTLAKLSNGYMLREKLDLRHLTNWVYTWGGTFCGFVGHLKRGRSDFVPISVGEDLGGAAISPGLSGAGSSWRDDHLFPRYSWWEILKKKNLFTSVIFQIIMWFCYWQICVTKWACVE